jgi:nucleoside-diphosphate-sugar epimerase
LGQIGRALIPKLQAKYGPNCVVGTDAIKPADLKLPCKFNILDIMHVKKMDKIVKDNNINSIIHFAAILSATGELMPEKAKDINIRGLEHVFDVALKHKCQ